MEPEPCTVNVVAYSVPPTKAWPEPDTRIPALECDRPVTALADPDTRIASVSGVDAANSAAGWAGFGSPCPAPPTSTVTWWGAEVPPLSSTTVTVTVGVPSAA